METLYIFAEQYGFIISTTAIAFYALHRKVNQSAKELKEKGDFENMLLIDLINEIKESERKFNRKTPFQKSIHQRVRKSERNKR